MYRNMTTKSYRAYMETVSKTGYLVLALMTHKPVYNLNTIRQ